MSAIPYEDHREDPWDDEQDDTLTLPRRPRRQFFNRRSATLLAVITCAAGFYAGIRVEKGQLASSSTSVSALSLPSFASSGSRGSGSAAGSRSSGLPTGGFPGGATFGGGNASIGTIASVNGKTIYVKDTSGNTVKVTLSTATKISKSLKVAKASLHPGDSVVVQGLKNSNGTVSATSVSDSGASGSTATSSSTTSSASSSGSSAVNSLFGSSGG